MNYQDINNKIKSDVIDRFRLDVPIALVLQLGWEYGELVEHNSDSEDFLETLYRYVGFAPDPPDEFIGFMTDESENQTFWGIEILVKSEK